MECLLKKQICQAIQENFLKKLGLMENLELINRIDIEKLPV